MVGGNVARQQLTLAIPFGFSGLRLEGAAVDEEHLSNTTWHAV